MQVSTIMIYVLLNILILTVINFEGYVLLQTRILRILAQSDSCSLANECIFCQSCFMQFLKFLSKRLIMFETNDQKKCLKRFKTIQCIKRLELLALFILLVKISKLCSMRRYNSKLMNEKRTSDKGQHSCRDAFVLLFICPMNGISFRKRHRVPCPLLILSLIHI